MRATYGGSGPTRSNTTKYDTIGMPIVSSQSIAAAMCTCCPGTGKGNCTVSVGVGVNLQLSKYGGDDSNFLYSLDSPVVCCNPQHTSCSVCAFVRFTSVSCKSDGFISLLQVESFTPSGGPIFGGTQITVTGQRFPYPSSLNPQGLAQIIFLCYAMPI